MTGRAPTRRLFFALWPDAATRRALAAAIAPLTARFGERMVPLANVHVTLAFLGNVAVGDLPRIEAAAQRLNAPSLVIDFDRLGLWRKPQVIVALASDPPVQAAACARALWEQVAPIGLVPDERPYAPHVTLVRKVGRLPAGGLPELAGPIRWEASDFVLVDSVTAPAGPEYRVISRWPLHR